MLHACKWTGLISNDIKTRAYKITRFEVLRVQVIELSLNLKPSSDFNDLHPFFSIYMT